MVISAERLSISGSKCCSTNMGITLNCAKNVQKSFQRRETASKTVLLALLIFVKNSHQSGNWFLGLLENEQTSLSHCRNRWFGLSHFANSKYLPKRGIYFAFFLFFDIMWNCTWFWLSAFANVKNHPKLLSDFAFFYFFEPCKIIQDSVFRFSQLRNEA